jgi:hypothetical protein
VSTARQLLEEALHLRMHGERAPGGNETWAEWDRKAEAYLRETDLQQNEARRGLAALRPEGGFPMTTRQPPPDRDVPGGDEPCSHRCGYADHGQGLLDHELWEHRPCTECGRGGAEGRSLDLHAVSHAPDCPRLQPGYVYPEASR